MLDPEWQKKEKPVDPNFEGSIWQKIGYENRLRPICKAHIREGICLNGCHLTLKSKWRFDELIRKVALSRKEENRCGTD